MQIVPALKSPPILNLLPLAIRTDLAAQITVLCLDIPLPDRSTLFLASRPHSTLLEPTKRQTPPTRLEPALVLNLSALALVVRALPSTARPLLSRFFLLLLLISLGLLFRSHGRNLAREPVDRPPQTAADQRQDDEVDAVSRYQQQAENELQGGEGDVCRYEERGRRARGEDGFPEVGQEVGHACVVIARGVCGFLSLLWVEWFSDERLRM